MRQPVAYRKADGRTVWRVRFRIAGRETTETFPSRQTAYAFARDLDELGPTGAVRRLEESMRRDHDLNVTQLTDEFLTWKTPRVRSDRTIADYRRDYRLWIAPTFGHRPSALVTPDDVRAWVDGMVAGTIARGGKPASAKSIHDRHALLHAIFAHGVRARHLMVNPCVGTELPKKRKGQPKGMMPAEWQAFYAALVQVDQDAADLALFLLSSGWRWSEATDVTTFDVEDDGERMWVTMSHVGRRNAAGKTETVVDGKGDASLRRIQLGPAAARMVRRRVAAAKPGGLVFTTGISPQNGLGGSRWNYGNFRDRAWDPAVKVSNLARKPTPHWLRHTAVVWLAQRGATMPELQARIGHENITTTIGTYGRMITDVQPAALSAFDAMITGPESAVRGTTPAPIGRNED